VQDPFCPHLAAGYAPDVPNAERSDGRDEDCADCETKQGMLDLIEREISLSGKLSEEQRARLSDITDRCPVHRTLTSEIKIRTRLV